MASRSGSPVKKNAKNALDQMKYEVAGELGVNLKQGYNGDNTARDNGSVGGFMVKRMFDQYYQKNGGTTTNQ